MAISNYETNENWQTIEDFSRYEVSDEGRIRNRKTGRILVATSYDKTSPKVTLIGGDYNPFVPQRKLTQYIHRLVAEYFLVDYDPERAVEFKNYNKRDCRAVNLKMGKRKVRTSVDSE